jgi:hypothetical protein
MPLQPSPSSPKRVLLQGITYSNALIMKQIIRIFPIFLALALLAGSCKKAQETASPSRMQDAMEPDPLLAPGTPAGHMAIGPPITGMGTPYFSYAGGPNYNPVIGSSGDNIIRNAAGGAPLPNVTGLAIVSGAAAFCLSRPGANMNWQIWKFPLSDPNMAGLWSTINATAGIVLTDLEKDTSVSLGRFLALDRTNLRLCQIPFVSGTTNINLSGSYAGVPKVSGLGVVGSTPFILGQMGTSGLLMSCTPALVPGWTLLMATYTPPAVPFIFTESGCFFDNALSSSFVVGSQAAGPNWTTTIPTGGPGAPQPPAWQTSNISIIDFAPL